MTTHELRHLVGRAATLALLAGLTTFAVAVGAGQHNTYQGPIPLAPAASPAPPVLWRDKYDLGREGVASAALAVGGERLFYLRDGILVAADLGSGRRLWSWGKGLKGPVAFGGGRVYVALPSGRVAAFSIDGRPLWTSADTVGRVEEFLLHGNFVIASYPDGGAAIDSATGRIRWRIREEESVGPVGVTGNLLLWQVYQGEPHADHLLAYTLTSGRQAWRVTYAGAPLLIEGERVFVNDEWTWTQLDDPDNVQIRIIDRRRGKELQRWSYRIDKKCAGLEAGGGAGRVVLDESFVYISERCADRVSRFRRAGARKPLVTYGMFDSGRWIAGPYRGVLFFETPKRALWGVLTEGGSPTNVNGVDMPTGMPRWYDVDNPISRLDLLGDLVLVGQTDGVFHALDFSSGRRLFSVRTAGRGFGPFTKTDLFLVVQAQGEVLVLKAPR